MKRFTAIILVLSCLSSLAQVQKNIYYFDNKAIPTEHPLDFQHLKLEVAFVPEEGKVIGTVTHDFKVLTWEVDTVYLHGPGINISNVTLDGEKINFHHHQKGFVFEFGKALKSGDAHQMVIEYTATPKKGIYFVGWNDESGRSRKQIWTQGQGVDNRYWIPMYDVANDKVTTEMIVTIDAKYRVLSNGMLLSEKKNKSGETTWHYKMKKPYATYLIMLGIGEYEVKKTKSPSGVPMHFYYYPDWEDRVEPTYRYSEDMMRFMEEETGIPYPWGTYSQIPVQNFLYGAMENTSATIYGDFYMVDERYYLDNNYVRVNAHELAHQWFGDYISIRTSTHTWLQESFATHYDLKYQRVAFGQDYYDWKRRKAAISALTASKSDLKPLAHSSAGTARHYPKGSYVLQMLREVAGNENYKKAINYYLKKYAFKNVDSHDLLIAFHESTGLSLNWFWEEWIYKGGEPSYKVIFETYNIGKMRFGRFDVSQVQELNDLTGLFKMPIDLKIYFEDGSGIARNVWVQDQNQVFKIEIPEGKNISFVLFDAESKVLKQVEFDKPVGMLLNQASKAYNMLDRYDAVKALQNTSAEIKRSTFMEIFKREKFHAVRSEIFRQLSHDPESREIWRMALVDKDHEVRKAAIKYTSAVPADLINEYEALLKDSSYIIIETALEKLSTYFEGTDKVQKYLDMTKGIEGNNERNVMITWLKIDYYQNSNQESLDALIDYVSPSYEFKTRVRAAKVLKSLNYLDETLLAYLFEGNFSFNARLRSPMKNVLDFYASTLQGEKMIKEVAKGGNWNDWEKKRLNLILR